MVRSCAIQTATTFGRWCTCLRAQPCLARMHQCALCELPALPLLCPRVAMSTVDVGLSAVVSLLASRALLRCISIHTAHFSFKHCHRCVISKSGLMPDCRSCVHLSFFASCLIVRMHACTAVELLVPSVLRHHRYVNLRHPSECSTSMIDLVNEQISVTLVSAVGVQFISAKYLLSDFCH